LGCVSENVNNVARAVAAPLAAEALYSLL
jgi:hypothetical protein